MKNSTDKIKIGDVFSEESHYVVDKINGDEIRFLHVEGKKLISINKRYTRMFLNSADQYTETREVTREDKKDGTLGIRSIFENIHSGQVFTVVFKKQDTLKSKKQFNEEREAQRQAAIAIIHKAKKQKKSMAVAYAEALEYIHNNPIKEITEGELRTLRGYKIQFNTRDGKYDCIDIDIKITGKDTGIRQVNINTIQELIYNGVKYIVK